MSMKPIVWLIIIIVLLIIEIATMGLTTVWFVGGGIFAFTASQMGAGWGVQFILFTVVSLFLLVFARPIAVRFMSKKGIKTNVDALIGQTAVVVSEVNNVKGEGTAMLNGLEWTARSEQESVVIPAGTVVEVLQIQGVKLIVQEKK
jgi:membrane protein implicated in regulation of membrane protease activity